MEKKNCFLNKKKEKFFMSFLSLFCQNSFVAYNKKIAKKISVQSAIVFGSLCSFHNIFCENDDDDFFINQEKISEETSLSLRAIRIATQELIEHGFIEVSRRGVPSKYFYKINADVVMNFMRDTASPIKSVTTSDYKSDTASPIKSVTTSDYKSDTALIKNILIKNKNKNSLNTESEILTSNPNLFFLDIREQYNAYGIEEHDNAGFSEYRAMYKELPQHSTLLNHIRECGERLKSWKNGYAPSLARYFKERIFNTSVDELVKIEERNLIKKNKNIEEESFNEYRKRIEKNKGNKWV